MTLATVPRYDETQQSRRDGHAVVVGASMAGLLAARVLVDAFEEVSVIERDPLPNEPVARRGVPQAQHIHLLLVAGQATLDDLFEGFGEDLISAGGVILDGAREANFYAEGDFLADGPRRIPLYAASRPLYEQIVRRHVAELDRVTLRPECQKTDYLVDDRGRTVKGIAVRDGSSRADELPADLVVDATGRTSRTPAWLAEQGYEPPPVDEVHVDVGYSSTFVERPADTRQSFVVPPTPPHTRGGGAQAVEDDRWMVTIIRVHGDYPPSNPEGFEEFAGSLPAPDLGALLEEHPRTGDGIVHYRFPSNVRRRYEDLNRFPDGLVVIGDAIASFNPIYGQGMSVAALEALALHHTLAAGTRGNLALEFFDRIAEIIDNAWNMAVGSDFQFPQTRGPRPRGTALLNRYLARLTRRAHTDGELADAFFRVMAMERPPSSLLSPGVVWRVFRPGN